RLSSIRKTAFYRRRGGLTSPRYQQHLIERPKLGSLWRAWSLQKRIWGALFMREIQVRWGRRNLGFAWLFAEPLIFAFPVLLMWSLVRSPFEHGLPLMPFLWGGYLS